IQRHALGVDAVLGAEASAVQGRGRARPGRVRRDRRVQSAGQTGETGTDGRLDFARHVHGRSARRRERHRVRLWQWREHDAAMAGTRPRRRRCRTHSGIDARRAVRARRADRRRAVVERRSDRVLESLQRTGGRDRPRLHRHVRRDLVLLWRGEPAVGRRRDLAARRAMPNQLTRAIAVAGAGAIAAAAVHAQGRGSSEWTTSGLDAQRTGWIRTDPRISPATIQKPGAFGPFKFLWKLKLEHDPQAPATLTQPILLDRLIGFRGFKSIAFVGTASETVHAIDIDFGVPLWKYHINYSASPSPVL